MYEYDRVVFFPDLKYYAKAINESASIESAIPAQFVMLNFSRNKTRPKIADTITIPTF